MDGMTGMPGGMMPGQRPPNLGGATAPKDPKGVLEMARVNVKIATDLLEQTIAVFGSESEEGSAVMKVLSTLSKAFSGKRSGEDLTNSQLMNMFSAMQRGSGPPGGQISPELMKSVGNQGGGMPQLGGGMPPQM